MAEQILWPMEEEDGLRTGDVVRLKSGGPLMTVLHAGSGRGDSATCIYVTERGRPNSSVYPVALLTKVALDSSQTCCWFCASEGVSLFGADDGNFYCGDCLPECDAESCDASCDNAAETPLLKWRVSSERVDQLVLHHNGEERLIAEVFPIGTWRVFFRDGSDFMNLVAISNKEGKRQALAYAVDNGLI